ncbi:hypothetical protein FA15DRAFT_251692 [Coprinopsis marcescibilis]|uniref:Uncharacterized protein n=1 Tax=Coprinopsis marcescibilis TaxID=230819 RepID=A0A5C3L1Q3_COPMA|nr:hypothetical protein FA15DRAFT_251692 [Coprinopsis marcescibilis]
MDIHAARPAGIVNIGLVSVPCICNSPRCKDRVTIIHAYMDACPSCAQVSASMVAGYVPTGTNTRLRLRSPRAGTRNDPYPPLQVTKPTPIHSRTARRLQKCPVLTLSSMYIPISVFPRCRCTVAARQLHLRAVSFLIITNCKMTSWLRKEKTTHRAPCTAPASDPRGNKNIRLFITHIAEHLPQSNENPSQNKDATSQVRTKDKE